MLTSEQSRYSESHATVFRMLKVAYFICFSNAAAFQQISFHNHIIQQKEFEKVNVGLGLDP